MNYLVPDVSEGQETDSLTGEIIGAAVDITSCSGTRNEDIGPLSVLSVGSAAVFTII